MPDISVHADLKGFEVPMDSHTRPFWDATALRKLLMPRCADCLHFRWPPGPFCPACHSQRVEWMPAGVGRVYSFTIIPAPSVSDDEKPQLQVPALIEFPDAGGIRLLAAIVDTSLAAIRIGVQVDLSWSEAVNATVPVFRIAGV